MAESPAGRGLHPYAWGGAFVLVGFLVLWLLLR